MELIEFIGQVHSPLKEIGDCPLLRNEGAPQVLVSINKKYQQAILQAFGNCRHFTQR